MFFEFRWNNFLHSVVYDMIAKVLNTFSYTASVPTSLAGNGPNPSDDNMAMGEERDKEGQDSSLEMSYRIISQRKMKNLRMSVKRLVVSIFQDAKLISQILNAQRLNDYEVYTVPLMLTLFSEQPKGLRLGYMGHLTYIADEVCKLFEKCSSELDDELHGKVIDCAANFHRIYCL